MNLFMKQKQTDRHIKQAYDYKRESWGGDRLRAWD